MRMELKPDEYWDLPLDGVFMFGQEQDQRGGGTDPSEGISGEYTQINMWDRVLAPMEIFKIATCKKVTGIIKGRNLIIEISRFGKFEGEYPIVGRSKYLEIQTSRCEKYRRYYAVLLQESSKKSSF